MENDTRISEFAKVERSGMAHGGGDEVSSDEDSIDSSEPESASSLSNLEVWESNVTSENHYDLNTVASSKNLTN